MPNILPAIVASGASVHSAPQIEGYTPVPVIDLDALQARTNKTAIQVSMLKYAIVVPLFAAGAILALVSIGQQAGRNWHETIIASEEQ